MAGHHKRAISSRRVCTFLRCAQLHRYGNCGCCWVAIAVAHKVPMELEYSGDQCHSCCVARCRGARTTSLKCPNAAAGVIRGDIVRLPPHGRPTRLIGEHTGTRLHDGKCRRHVPGPVIRRVLLLASSCARDKFVASNFNGADVTATFRRSRESPRF